MAQSKKAIEKEIAEYEELINATSGGVTEDEKEFAREEVKALKEKLAKMEEKEEKEEEKEEEEKKERKPRRTSAPKPKKAEAKKAEPKKEGKAEEPSCDDLLKAWKERRASAKKAAKKAKTRSVFAIIADKVEDAVTKAIKTVPAGEIKADPQRAIKNFTKLESSMQSFLQDFRTVLGEDYEASEVKSAVAHIEDLIKKLKARYEK